VAARGGGQSAYQRRNARARALGYRSYYDYRVHQHGRIPPDQAAPARGSAERARLRGHRSTADLVRTIRPGDVVVVPEGLQSIPKRGDRYTKIEVLLLKESGRAERFTMRRATYERVTRVLEQMAAAGAIFSPAPSLDLRRLVRTGDRPEVDDDQ